MESSTGKRMKMLNELLHAIGLATIILDNRYRKLKIEMQQ